MVTITFDLIETHDKRHCETLEAARSRCPAGTVRLRRISLLQATVAKKVISLATGFVAQDHHQPKIELGL